MVAVFGENFRLHLDEGYRSNDQSASYKCNLAKKMWEFIVPKHAIHMDFKSLF